MSSAPAFEFVEGATSDLAFVARGATCEQALVAATRALLAATVEEPEAVRATLRRDVTLEEPDLDLLLLRLLNELVYLRDAEGLLLFARRVRIEQGPHGPRLEAELAGEPWDAARHHPAGEVKAATAHGLALREGAGGWEARATLDV
jgi:SHS2 domain-containing protein